MALTLFRRTDPSQAPWQSWKQGGVPLDAAAAPQDTPIQASMPDRAPSALRAAVTAFAVLLSPTPPDAGTLPANVSMPHRAPASARTANSVYTITVPSPVDAGIVTVAPPVASDCPDFASGAKRASQSAYSGLLSVTPQDAGSLAFPASMPHRAIGSPRTASSAYTIAVPSRPDVGVVLPIVQPPLPVRAIGWQRTANSAYLIIVPSPVDAGGAPPPPPGNTGWILLESGWKLLLESGDAYLLQATGPPAPTPGASGWFLREDNWRILLESGDYFLIESVNPVPPPGSTGYILLENGWRLLLENGSAYLLENANQAVPSVFPDPQKASWNIKNTPSNGVVVNYEIYQGIGTDYYVTQGYGVPGTVYFVSPGKATWAIKVASPLKSSWNLKKS